MAPMPSKKGAKPSSSSSSKPRTKSSSKATKARSVPQQVKPKRPVSHPRKKQRVYTEKELGIPKLNMITPAGIQKQRGKKKGKVFVDDRESMMTILAIVNADKEGQIESKMVKARHMEEIREARRKEQEVRQGEKKSILEDTKDSLRQPRRKVNTEIPSTAKTDDHFKPLNKSKKRVSFG